MEKSKKKVLWVCNLMPAFVASAAGLGRAQNKEGWISGAAAKVMEGEELSLAVAFPVKGDEKMSGSAGLVRYFSFYEDTDHPEEYDPSLEASIGRICEEFKPDVIHCFGTEFPHSLALQKLTEWRDKVIVHIQGVMQSCAEQYYGGLDESVTESATIRDIIRSDSLWKQKEKYEKRAEREKNVLSLAAYACGRTAFDKAYVESINPSCAYFAMNETLRPGFYGKLWERENSVKHRIFMSQGNIPLKGLHVAIEALALIKEKYEDAHIVVAGDDIVGKPFYKIPRYGKYLKSLTEKLQLKDSVSFMGQLNETEMCQEYMEANVYVLASYTENSPNSLGEAMLLGVPSVVSRVGGVPSMAEEDKEVLAFDAGDAKGLAEKICRLFDSEELQDELRLAARKRAMLTHDAEANYKMLLWIYDRI
ncbi:MAG: glycosyltransferase family 4 protein [Lachnospiraceae bacterium]|nr:glycosyltransferase family 4 protein [Lachnospiraceae bacterium]